MPLSLSDILMFYSYCSLRQGRDCYEENTRYLRKLYWESIAGIAVMLLAETCCAAVLDVAPGSGAVFRSTDGGAFVGGLPLHDGHSGSSGAQAVLLDRIAAYDHLLVVRDSASSTADLVDPGVDPMKTGAPAAGVFGSITFPIHSFPVTKRWAVIMRGISECAVVGACAGRSELLDRIASETEGRTLAEKVGIVNSLINNGIRYRADRSLYGNLDHWATPAEILVRGSGDCEDFAILKMTALIRAGLPAQQSFARRAARQRARCLPCRAGRDDRLWQLHPRQCARRRRF